MTLRTASLRIDPVSRSVDRHPVRLLQRAPQGGEPVEATVAGNGPGLLEDQHRGRPAGLQRGQELRPERLDAPVADVVKEVKVVDEARRLPQPEPEQRVNAAGG